MSRRFGRQQKHRMRAELAEKERKIASLAHAVTMSDGLASNLRSKLYEHREYLGYIIKTINNLIPNSALLPPKTVIQRIDVRGGAIRVDISPAQTKMVYELSSMPTEEVRRTIELHVLEATIERHSHELATHAHLRLVDTNNHQAYAVSDKAVWLMHPHERKRIALEIAERLLCAIEKGARR